MTATINFDDLAPATDDTLRLDFDHCGGVRHVMTAWLAPYDWTDAEIAEAVRELMPRERCYHAYDCCGRFYGGAGEVAFKTYYHDEERGGVQLVYVHRTYTQNV